MEAHEDSTVLGIIHFNICILPIIMVIFKISDVDVGLLIKLVQNFPHIYDHRHKSFKNSTLKENTWKKIAATIKVPGR